MQYNAIQYRLVGPTKNCHNQCLNEVLGVPLNQGRETTFPVDIQD